jgi:hypothetical protein
MDSWKRVRYQLVISELEQMARYLDLMNSGIQDNQQKLEADLKAMTNNMTEEERSDFYDFHEDDMIEAGSDFPTWLFSSFIINWYSFIEYQLISLCKILGFKISASIQDNTRPLEGIGGASKFLKEAEKYKIDNAHWAELQKVRKIRNKLVHEGGILILKPTKSKHSKQIDLGEDGVLYLPIDSDLYRYLSEHNLYRVGQSRFTPSYTYCKHLVKFGTDLLTKIYKDFNLST